MEKDLFFESNMKLLKKNHHHIWEMVMGLTTETEIIISENGKPNIRIESEDGDNFFLHDNKDPSSEGETFLKIVKEDSRGVVIFQGMGLGYGPIEILKSRKDIRFLIIFELVTEFFILALKNMNLKPLLKDPRVIFAVGPEPNIQGVLSPASRAMRLEDISMLRQPPSFKYRKDEYEKLASDIYNKANELNISSNTYKAFGRNFVSNRLSFLSMLNHTSLIDALGNKFNNIPAIIVASGPSLSKNISLLKNFKDKAVIIAADSALPALLENEVMPNFVTAIDYRDVTYEKISSVASQVKEVSLICSSWVCKNIPKIFPAENIFWTYTNSPMENWINTSLGGRFSTPGAGTVAHLNLISAIAMKCSPIVFVGQDLSFSPSQTDNDHIKGTVIRTDNELSALLKNKDEIVWVKANSVDDLPTTRPYYGFIKHFERMIKANPGHYINATQGGAFIEGTEIETLEKVLNKYCSKDKNIREIIEKINNEERLSNLTPLIKEAETAIELVKKVKKIINKGDKAIKSANFTLSKLKNKKRRYKNINNLPKSLLKDFQAIDSSSEKADKEDKLWKLFDEATMNALMHTDRMKQDIDSMEGNEEKYLEWISKNMERLKEVNRVRTELLTDFENILEKFVSHQAKEKELLARLEKSENDKDCLSVRMELASLYIESEDLILAKPHLEEILKIDENNPEASFLMGQIASYHCEFEIAENLFNTSKESNDSYLKKVDGFIQKMGDLYLDHAEFARNPSVATQRKMVQKGLKYCPGHNGLIKELNDLVIKDSGRISESSDETSPSKQEDIIKSWEIFFESNKEVEANSSRDILEIFYQSCGKFYTSVLKDNLKSIGYLHKALILNDKNPETRLLLSDLFFSMGENRLGLDHFNKAIEIDSQYTEEYEKRKLAPSLTKDDIINLINQGNNFFSQNRLNEALESYLRILDSDPGHSEALHNLGVVYKTKGNPEKAAELYNKAIESNPHHYYAFFNLGIVYFESGEKQKAFDFFKKAIEIKPDFTGALINAGNSLKAMNRLEEAEFYYNHVLEIDPGYVDALNNLGVIYQEKGESEKAISCFKKFLEKKPDNLSALENIINELQYACEWSDLKKYIDNASFLTEKNLKNGQLPAIKPFQSLRIKDDPNFHLSIARAFAPGTNPNSYKHFPGDHKNGKIHLGYISGDFKDHPIGHLFSNFVGLHDGSKFKVSCFSTTPDPDNFYGKIIRNNCDEFHDISSLGYHKAAEKIYNSEVDILIDLTGHTKGSNLMTLSFRPAPVQVSYLGFLGTSGADFIDYIISDKIVTPPETADLYSERFVYLPDCYQITDYSHLKNGRSFTRKDFNLPENRVVFCSFNQPYKYEPEVLGLWMRIMTRVKDSVLWLWATNTTAMDNIREFALNNGVARERIIFSQKIDLSDHLKRLELADIALDTITYNGGATTNNALWAGLPLITIQGKSFISRMSSSSLTALGMGDLITYSLQEYEELAVSLGNKKSQLKKIKERIAIAKSKKHLFNIEKFIKDLEALMEKIHNNYINGINSEYISKTR